MSMEQEFITYLNGWLVKHCTTAVDEKTIADLAYFFNAGAEAQRKEADRYRAALERIAILNNQYTGIGIIAREALLNEAKRNED